MRSARSQAPPLACWWNWSLRTHDAVMAQAHSDRQPQPASGFPPPQAAACAHDTPGLSNAQQSIGAPRVPCTHGMGGDRPGDGTRGKYCSSAPVKLVVVRVREAVCALLRHARSLAEGLHSPPRLAQLRQGMRLVACGASHLSDTRCPSRHRRCFHRRPAYVDPKHS